MNTIVRALVTSAIIAICLPTNGHASITGTITDFQGNPVSGAQVTFTDESDYNRNFTTYSDEIGQYEIDLTTSVEEYAPIPFALGQNYPNPFNPVTTIPFTIAYNGHVSLTIYNVMGQKVRTLIDSYLIVGNHHVIWDGIDEQGNHVSAGVYLYQIRNDNRIESKKMLLLDGGYYTRDSNIGFASKIFAANEMTSYHVSVRAYGFIEYVQSGVQVIDNSTYDYELTAMMRIHEIPFVSIIGGTFQMGDQVGDLWNGCRPIHTVTVSTFEMSAYEITNAQYAKYLNEAIVANEINVTSETVTGAIGSWSSKVYINLAGFSISFPNNECKITYSDGTFSVKTGFDKWPATYVTWYGAKAYTEHYGIDLPREAEWEYASRWGSHQYLYGTDNGTINKTKAHFIDSGIVNPGVVGTYPANPFSLYDMSGNVWEWCEDWYGLYSNEVVIDPTGPQTGDFRVSRGGGWYSSEVNCRSAYRSAGYPHSASFETGFRVVNRTIQK